MLLYLFCGFETYTDKCESAEKLVAGKSAELPKHVAKICCLSRFKTRFGTIWKSAMVPKIERPHAHKKKCETAGAEKCESAEKMVAGKSAKLPKHGGVWSQGWKT